MKPIDLRSDTVTRPSEAMRRAMAAAVVGDDVYGEDPTVRSLEERIADLLGKQAALFVPSGTQSNLIALFTHCARGEEFVCGFESHVFRYEAGGGCVLAGLVPYPLPFESDGTLPGPRLEARACRADDSHTPRTRLVCLENTWGGRIIPLEALDRFTEQVRTWGLKLHLDGARIWNACVALDLPAARIGGRFDSLSVCLSKGLGAPAGSLLCGSSEFVAEARRWRKMLGGGMRQAGVLAAAGHVALDEELPRLAEDHERTAGLASLLARLPGAGVEATPTNMLYLSLSAAIARTLPEKLSAFDVVISAPTVMGDLGVFRLVLHRDVGSADVQRAGDCFAEALGSVSSR